MFETPILFLIFNRPDTTAQVFEAIRKQKPKFLYVAADGPRPNKEGEAEICQQVRDLIINGINWDCEVKTLFREENLGCGKAVSSAITWFFENVEEGIILEDDCLPNDYFFSFCEELLKYYRNDLRIAVISGYNPLGAKITNDTYFFSLHTSVWGWASWKNRWNNYDFNIKLWDDDSVKKYMKTILPPIGFETLSGGLDSVQNGQIDTWDYQLAFSTIAEHRLAIKPYANLITNIGITGSHAAEKDKNHFVPYGIFPNYLKHPKGIIPDIAEDTLFYKWNYPDYEQDKIIAKIVNSLKFNQIKRLLISKLK